MTERTTAVSTQCENCGASLEGDFCSCCGQSIADFNLPLGAFAKEFASEAFSLDSRLALTLKSLFFRPGSVPKAYVAGRRARFVPPIRIYIFASFAMFLLLSLGSGLTVTNVEIGSGVPTAADSASALPDSANELGVATPPDMEAAPDTAVVPGVDAATDVEPDPETERIPRSFQDRLQDRFMEGFQRMNEDTESFSRDFMNRIAQAMFFLLPAFALLLKLVHRRRLYVQHLVFAVYYHSFVFIVVAVVMLPDALGLTAVSEWLAIALLTIPAYLLLAMKRFYEDAWLKTVLKFAFVGVTYTSVWAVTWMAVLAVALLAT